MGHAHDDFSTLVDTVDTYIYTLHVGHSTRALYVNVYVVITKLLGLRKWNTGYLVAYVGERLWFEGYSCPCLNYRLSQSAPVSLR